MKQGLIPPGKYTARLSEVTMHGTAVLVIEEGGYAGRKVYTHIREFPFLELDLDLEEDLDDRATSQRNVVNGIKTKQEED